jgi:predicted ArsR family transcriptional regulator
MRGESMEQEQLTIVAGERKHLDDMSLEEIVSEQAAKHDGRALIVYRTTGGGLRHASSKPEDMSQTVFSSRLEAFKAAKKLAAKRGVHGAVVVQDAVIIGRFGKMPEDWRTSQRS